MRNRIGLLAAALLASFALTGAGQVVTPSAPENERAAHAVAVLTGGSGVPAGVGASGGVGTLGRAGASGGEVAAVLPADLAAVVGYEPLVVTDPDGSVHVTDPDGGCSWLGDTTYGFDRACRSHDLGYDLLRYATAKGGELGPWARRAIDERFAADLRSRCAEVDGGAACSALARLTTSAVGFNSWRQGYGNPGSEAVWPYLVSAVLIAGAAAGPSIAVRCRQRWSR
ncbi:hypothetical protein E1262_05215 [Jiangella aurantiaca]|uniref:Phospholipase n=1 Tax=Jiangella aurantiaca TaxID=2530373 RepID=A0A4R5AIM3_9ACTN|nr:phospholipase A2 [Jiangella aurantiaca]TDD71555.1 hypothetical protein E1262_05215 [Jiangella aurantiaca]